MNLESNYQDLLRDLFDGQKAIAVFVVKGKHYYVIDDKENYCIDVRPEYKAYVDKGIMKESLYEEAIRFFRNGLPVLTEDNFHEYIIKNNIVVYSVEDMKGFFTSDRSASYLHSFYDYVEKFLSVLTDPVSNEWDQWKMRLPKFYINFDKKIYRHTDWDRSHEASVPPGWNAQANSDFGLFIPDKEQYWLIDGMNFWKLQM